MRKTTKKKAIVTTAFLATLMTLGIITPIFWIDNNTPPLGTYIHIVFTCSQTGKPIVGLPVTIGATTETTDASGEVVFGSGYVPGTYTYTFEWLGKPYSKTVTIDCSQQHWFYYEALLNREVHKWFFIELRGEPVPYAGLEVTLNPGYGTKITDADGYVAWILDYPFGDYTLEWTWNGQDFSEPVHFEVGQVVWEKENTLEPKSGGGHINLHLAEEIG